MGHSTGVDVEGIRTLLYYTGLLFDKVNLAEDEEEKARYKGLIELLTPILKAYCGDARSRFHRLIPSHPLSLPSPLSRGGLEHLNTRPTIFPQTVFKTNFS